jgi:hypothetical protein
MFRLAMITLLASALRIAYCGDDAGESRAEMVCGSSRAATTRPKACFSMSA